MSQTTTTIAAVAEVTFLQSDCLGYRRPSSSSALEPFLDTPVLNGSWADEMDWQDGLYVVPDSPALRVPSLPEALSWEATTPPARPFSLRSPSAAISVCGSSPSLSFSSPVEPSGRMPPRLLLRGRDGRARPRNTPTSPALSSSSSITESLSSSWGSSRSATPPPLSLSEGSPCAAAAEVALVEVFVQLLQDPALNPHSGSVSLEKLRVYARARAPEVLEAVLGPVEEAKFPWKVFLSRHKDRLRKVPGTTRRIKVYLTGNYKWRESDERLKACAVPADHHLWSASGCFEMHME